MRTKYLHSFLAALFFLPLLAQDPQFTQFYSSPLYLNPAFTGLTYEHRFALNARQQWPGIGSGYKTLMASYDYNLSDLNSGIGAYVLYDQAGSFNLSTLQFGLNYAYSIKVNKFSEIRAGISVAASQKYTDNTRLVFNNQLANLQSTGGITSGSIQKANYTDLGIGGLYNSTNYWFGFAAKHINQPNTSLVGDVQPLPVSLSVHGGYRYIISARGSGKTKLEEFVSASVNYRRENKYDQLDIGAYYFKNAINFGLWYRGLPLKHYKAGYTNRESVAILIGFETDKNFRVGLSYDITVSKLGLNNTYGASEIAIVYEIAKKRKRNKRVLVSCPKF
jgi:type IX secretion system PorP/SprF family membrane protein